MQQIYIQCILSGFLGLSSKRKIVPWASPTTATARAPQVKHEKCSLLDLDVGALYFLIATSENYSSLFLNASVEQSL